MYVEQIEEGQSYDVFKRCVSISILDFTLFHDTDEFYSCFHLLEDNRHTLYTDKMKFHILELSKLPKELKEDTSDILLWAKFISAEKEEEFTMLATKNPYIKYENSINIAKNFLALGLPLSTIAQGTGLSEEQIKQLQQEIPNIG